MNHEQEKEDIQAEREREAAYLYDSFVAAIRYGNGLAEPDWAPIYCKGTKYERKATVADLLNDAMDDLHSEGPVELVMILAHAMASHDQTIKNLATDFVKSRAAYWVRCNAE